ncbi:MAG: helix-turn-helix domain-containing protein [Gammaproteobacteria bacterium]
MDYYSMTDQAILDELGGRFRELRLRKNLTQRELAERTALSVTAIKSLEAGRTRLQTAVAVLRELGRLDELDHFVPPPGISPMQLAKLGGKKRERASGTRRRSAGPTGTSG